MRLLFSFTFCFVFLAVAQVPVGLNLPEDSVITVSVEQVLFDLEGVGFPPPEFPAYYPATESIDMQLYSNITGNWVLHIGMQEGFVNPEGFVIPSSQLEYRLDGGLWLPLSSQVSLLSGSGASTDYETYTLELRLKLVGNERPRLYQAFLNFSLSKL